MTWYILKRFGLGILTIFVLTSITFMLAHAMPGNPFTSDKYIPPDRMEMLLRKYGLDKSKPEQYLLFLKNLLKGQLGESVFYTGRTVESIIMIRMPVSAKLGLVAFVIAVVVGIAFGMIAAFTRSQALRNALMVFATLGVSIPGFLFALMLMIVLGVKLRLLPIMGLTSFRHYIMPAFAMALHPISVFTRMVRSSMTEVIKQDYMVLARAKGLSTTQVYVRHGLKNALLPVVTMAGPMIASFLMGSFVVENLFSIPGIGSEFVSSISNRDYTMIMGLVVFLGGFLVLANLMSDILSALVDPRIRIQD